MRRVLLQVCCLLALAGAARGQVTVFSDNFNRASLGATWTTTTTAGDGGASILSSDQLELTNDASATANANGRVYTTAALSGFSSPFNTTLNLNSGTVTWTFNMQQIRADPSGFASGSYGVAFVLVGSNSNLTAGQGYAVVLGQSGTTDNVRLVKFNGGLTADANLTNIVSAAADIGAEYLSVKVTYIPSSNTWELFTRTDGTSAFAAPTSGTLTTAGTAVDNTYTSTAMSVLGAWWNYATAAAQSSHFDNLTVSVTVAPPNISTQPSTQTVTSGATVSFTVAATGTGTLSYQWRKGGTNIVGETSATLSLGAVTTTNAGSYDVVVSDTFGNSTTSSAATLTVNKISTTLAFTNTSATYDGSSHAITVTPTPSSGVTLSTSYTATSGTTYGPSTTAPTNAGVYTATTTITDSEHVVSGGNTSTFTINQASATVAVSNLTATYDGSPHAATITTTPSSLANSVTYAGSATAPTNAGSYAVVATITDPNYSGTSTGSPTLVISQATQSITFGALANHFTSDPPFTVSASASSGLAVSFSITSGSPTVATISGATITLAGGASTGSVTVQASQAGNTNYAAATPVSQSFTIALPPATITTQPSPQTVTAFTNASFTVAATVGSGTLTYQWRKNGSAITGNASALTAALTLTSVTAADAASYDVLITAPGGTVQSNPATLTVNQASAPVALGSLAATYDGATHAASATTSPAGLAVSFTYNGSASAPSAAGSYAVVGTISDANYAGTASGTLVIAKAAQSITFPTPTGTLRATVPFTVSATASSGLTPVTFSIVSGNATATGTNGATITVADNLAPTVVRATQAGNANFNAASLDLSVSVNVAPLAPTFIVQPTAAASYNYGDSVVLTATVAGIPEPTYQWRKDGVALTANATATSPSLFLAGLGLADAGVYDLVATNATGTARSFGVSITVAKKAQTITFDAPMGTFGAGAPVKLTASASSGLPVTLTIVSGAGSLVGSTLTGFGASVVVRAAQAGTANFTAADSIDRTFTFVAGGSAPFLFSAPFDQTASAGATVTFSAAAIGTPAPAWSWAKDGVAIAGATSANLTLANVTLADAARYTVTATNSAGSVNASATLSVRAAPAFTASPASQSVNAGTNVALAVAVTGFPAPALQWRKNGVAIRGAVTDKLTLVNVSGGDAASYDVVATNALGTATSSAATLAVTTHDFSGVYFGKFAGAAGDFALYVRANGTGVFIGFLPGSKTAIVATNVVVDLAGNFSLNVTAATAAAALSFQRSALSSGSDPSPITSNLSPGIAAAPAAVTLRGTLNDATGTLSATVPELGITLDGARAASTGAAAAQAGFYSGALVGSADGRGYVIVGADGQAFALAASSSSVDGASGTVGSNGRLTLTTTNQSTVDLGFANGALSGTVKSAAGITASLNGATDALAGTERLANISARGGTAPGAPLIAGFVVNGAAPKQVLIRAAGPALAGAPFNVAGALDDPALQLFRGNTIIAQNDNWSTPANAVAALTAAATSVNAFTFRAGSADAALLTTLAPGNYTVQISASAASANPTGVVLAEIYEILETTEAAGARRLANLSARGPVAPGAPLIAGFVINGTAPQRVLIRGIGPALAAFGVPAALANPTLTLFRGSTALRTNDDWFRDPDAALIRDAATKTGAFALGASSLDAALLLYLDPGAYTAQVSASGTTNGTGTALVEIYEAP